MRDDSSLAKYVLAFSTSILWLAASGFGQSITVAPASGPPSSTVLVSGSGFSAGADVDIYFDIIDLAITVTDDTGSFSQVALRIPASALPGKHTVSAKEPSTGASAQTPVLVNTNWSQFRMRPSHDGHNRSENVLSPATVGGLSLLWKYTMVQSSGSSPAVVNGVVYAGSSGVTALEASTGALLWYYSTGAGTASPAVSNGVVYVTDQYSAYALNASTGALLWKYQTSGLVYSSPAVAHGVVYFGFGGSVYALNASSGALLWKNTTGGGVSSPAVANGMVYVASDKFYARNAATGALVWKYTTGGGESSPAVANGVVYAGSNEVLALNAISGTLLWKHTIGAGTNSSPAVANGMVYLVGEDGIYAFGLTGSDAPALPQRPDPQTLSPDLSLPVSRPSAIMPATDE